MSFDVAKVSSAKGERRHAAQHGRRENQARVVKTDIAASNGVITVIDTVMLPPGK